MPTESSAAPVPDSPAQAAHRQRLRRRGAVILVIGLAAAALTYWIESRNAEPSIEDLLPGTAAAHERQMGILYGPALGTLMDWTNDLIGTPGGHALLIAGTAAIVAGVCFHVARLPEP